MRRPGGGLSYANAFDEGNDSDRTGDAYVDHPSGRDCP
jgi:hypothetical protein